jgi:hypothetical protein
MTPPKSHEGTMKLTRFIRRVFAVLEVLTVTMMVIWCVAIFALPRLSADTKVDLGRIGLKPETGKFELQYGNPNRETLTLKNLQGDLALKNPSRDDHLYKMIKACELPVILLNAAFLFVLCELLRRQFRNVERGETFSEPNIRLVRKIGVTILAFALLSGVAQCWYNYEITTYLQPYVTVQGIHMVLVAPTGPSAITFSFGHFDFHIGLGRLLFGLLVLSLGEVFRQGLALKEETALTI